MLKLKIFSIGKFKEKWLEEAIRLYTQRLIATMQIEWIWAKDNKQLIDLVQEEPFAFCLSPEGQMQTSEEFSQTLFKNFEKYRSRLSFIIGGAEGLPEQLKQRFPLLSFSRLTFTHQMTFLLLIEQVYRAAEIQKNSRYHK
jgi:23S rRNA (pseudouridine1915-N3)-methyltransferase